MNEQNDPTGFIGIDGSLVAMRSIAPTTSGTGIGTTVLQTDIRDYGVTAGTVNEQNPWAQQFYAHRHFHVTDCQATEDQAGRIHY